MLDSMRELFKENTFIQQNHDLSWHGNWSGWEEFQKVPNNACFGDVDFAHLALSTFHC